MVVNKLMSQVSEFGKMLRKIRVDEEETLKDMANKLGCSVSFLSAVERGKKNVPAKWKPILQKLYGIKDAEWQLAVATSNVSAKELGTVLRLLFSNDACTIVTKSGQTISSEKELMLYALSNKLKEERK